MVRFGFKLAIHGQQLDMSFQDITDLTLHAEEAGFDGVFVIDHLLLPGERLSGYTNADPKRPYFLDAWTSLAALAAVTSRIRLGPQVTPIGLRHPTFVAKWAATVDQISNGRLFLQVGAGHQEIEYKSFGFPYPDLKTRVARLREGIEVIRRLWSSDEAAEFQGEHYVLESIPFWPKPVQPNPEIWLGGASGHIRRVVADLGDGWSPAATQGGGLEPEFFRSALQEIRDRAGDRGPSIGGGAMFYTIIDDDPRVVSERLGILQRRADWADLTPAEFRERGIALAGNPEEVIDAIQRYVDAGIEYVTVGFIPVDGVEATHEGLEMYRQHIIPHFSQSG